MSEVNEYIVYLVFLMLMVTNNGSTKSGKYEFYTQCGGLINKTKGIIQTPGFPERFPVPIQCRWVIDASSYPQKTIVVYFTQLYVNTGLEFWDYMIYEYDTGMKYGENLGHAVTPKNVTSTPWIRSFSPFLVIEFKLDRLEGNHLRFLDDKHNVYFTYGFNITFELIEANQKVRDGCSARMCSLVGNCYADSDFSKYWCSCFPGFSGPDCSRGPLCEDDTCYNGGTCVHTSAVSYGCTCTEGFAGSKCEFPIKLQCDGIDCNRTQCFYDGYSQPECDCSNAEVVPHDRARYESVMQATKTNRQMDGQLMTPHKTKAFESQLGKQVSRFLGYTNVTKIDNFKLLNLTHEKIVFHFFGYKSDFEKITEGLNRFAERGYLNITPANITVKQEPTLLIESVSASKSSIRVGQEFSISCVAKGSVFMTFTWLKDDVSVNEDLATRSVSFHLIELSEGRYQYTLIVDKAHPLDEGIYTCHVSDWNVQQCKGIHLSIATPPEIQLIPMSATVERGASLVVICIPLNNRPNHEKFGYTWIKNRHLLKETPGREVWEDLYLSHYNDMVNTGIILEITDIQKSATYTCQVKGNGEPSELSINIDVVNKSLVPLCQAEVKFDVFWPTTSPGFETVADCPYHTKGFARRRCRLTDFNTTQWLLPDFTECLSLEMEYIYNNFTRLTLGYEVTNGSLTLSKLYGEISRKPSLLPGESKRILEALSDVQEYLNYSSFTADIVESAEPFFDAIDFTLGNKHSMINEKQVTTLQDLVIQEGVIWGSLQSAPHHIHVAKNSIYIEILTLSSRKAYRNAFPQKNKSLPGWTTDRVTVYVDATDGDSFGDESITIIYVSYRNLSQFLPIRYLSKLNDGTDLEYEISSRLLTVEIGQNKHRIGRVGGNFWVEVELDSIAKESNPDLWNWTCAVTDSAGYRSSWDLTSCTGKLISGNVTKCHCRRTGTYAVLLVSGANSMDYKSKDADSYIVLIGCGSCLIQSVLTLCFLLPYWWRHKTSLVFLKMQCCLATSGAMSMFMYSVQYSVPKSLLPYITTFLEIFLLISLSSHLSKVLIVYAEIIQLPKVRHIKETVVCIITGAPVLAVLCNLLGYHTTGWILKSWWIIKGSMVFNVFIACAVILIILFLFLYVIVLRKLYHLIHVNSDKSKVILRRLGLLKRGGIIFFAMVLMESASIFYINVLDVTSQFFFCGTSILLGLSILICYVLKSETPIRARLWKSFKMDPTTPDDDFSSESIINPLSFFTKQDGDAESEAAAPRRNSGIRGRNHKKNVSTVDMSEQLLMSDTRLPVSDGGGTNTQETYVYSADDEGANSKYKQYKYRDAVYRDQEGATQGDETWKTYDKQNGVVSKTGLTQRYMKEPSVTSQEIITTRVCVELGVITTHQRNEMTGQEVATPAIVLCSVDVEPCQSRVVEMSEVLTDSICCNGISNTGSFVLGVTGQETEVCSNSGEETSPDEEKAEDDECAAVVSSGPEGDEEKKQLEGNQEAGETSPKQSDQMEGMLDRISHDLDYLLNRKSSRKGGKAPTGARGKVHEDEEDGKNQYLYKC